MMTPQEVSEHAFSKASFGGYNMAMVDEFLDLLTEDYTTLYKENATLKAKMKVLVEKVEEYRSTEDAMRKALLTAQKMADDMLAEAEEKKSEILAQAGMEAKAKMAGIQQEVANEQARLDAAKSSSAAYIAKLKALYQHEMEYLSSLSELSAAAPETDRVAQAANDITASVEKLVAEAQAQVRPVQRSVQSQVIQPPAQDEDGAQDIPLRAVDGPSKEPHEGGLYAELMGLNLKAPEGERRKRRIPAAEDEDPDDPSPTQRMDFSNLQFGRDYKIT